MIILRKPCRIYDVDLIGVGVLVALGLGAYYGAWVPHRAQAQDHSELSASIGTVERHIVATRQRRGEVESHVEQLSAAIGEQSRRIPALSELGDVVNAIFGDAKSAGLHISSVKPNTPVLVDEYLACDLEILGHGFATELIAFLDGLARERPYHSLEAYTLSRDRRAGDDQCMITLRLRVYLAADNIPTRSGESP